MQHSSVFSQGLMFLGGNTVVGELVKNFSFCLAVCSKSKFAMANQLLEVLPDHSRSIRND